MTLTTSYTYDAAGRLLSTDGPLAGTDDATYNRYDAAGRRIWEIGAVGANGLRPATHTVYRDSDDKVIYTETGTLPDKDSVTLTVIGRTDISYDSRRNPVRTMVTASSVVQGVTDRAYYDSGNLACEAQRMNRALFGALPGSACLPSTAGADGPDRITHNDYDAAGQLTQVQRAYTTAIQQNYATYTYSANGRQTSVTDANGNRAEMTWDGFDRQRRWIFPSRTTPGTANPSDYEDYGYDIVNNRTSVRKRDGTTLTFGYDNLHRMTLKTVPASATGAPGYSVHYGYDVANAQLYARFGSATGPGVANLYDGFGRTRLVHPHHGRDQPDAGQPLSRGRRPHPPHPCRRPGLHLRLLAGWRADQCLRGRRYERPARDVRLQCPGVAGDAHRRRRQQQRLHL